MSRIVIVGGGPAGYEAALVAVELGAEVTLVDRDGIGGACVLWDCVPSKTLIATSDLMTIFGGADELGVRVPGGDETLGIEADRLFTRVNALAGQQSRDIHDRLQREGVRLIRGTGRLLAADRVKVTPADGDAEEVEGDAVLLATGGTPRVLPGAEPDGERILDWRQVYDLPALPDHLVVVGSGVTGAEFASAFRALGADVTLVSSRDRVLPGEDEDAARVVEEVFTRRGITVLGRSRATGVRRLDDGVCVELDDGREVEATHVLLAVGSVPRTDDLGLEDVGVERTDSGHIKVDRVSRTSVNGVYAAGDCTGVLALASVAAMQGRIAMWHSLGEAVSPLRLATVAANVFTDPEIATVGVSQAKVAAGEVTARVIKMPLATNARAKMEGITDGFVKVFARPGSGTVLGGVVVAPSASELILPLSLAVQHSLTVDQVAHTFAVYPSLSGSLTEAARQLMVDEEG